MSTIKSTASNLHFLDKGIDYIYILCMFKDNIMQITVDNVRAFSYNISMLSVGL